MSYRRQSGFTLVEVMVVMAIIGIFAVVAIPSYLSYRPEFILNRAVNDYYGNIQTMRALAIKNRGDCSITFTNTSYTTTCTTSDYTETVEFDEYDGLVVFEMPDGSNGLPGGASGGVITCGSRGTCNQLDAHITNTNRENFYRIGPFISGFVKKQYWDGTDWESL